MNGAHRAPGRPAGPAGLVFPAPNRRPLAVALAAGVTALIAGFTLGAPAPAHAAPGPSGDSCSAPLTYGRAQVTRTTRWIGNGRHRYYTRVVEATTGDEYQPVVNRGVGANPISGVVNRVQRGTAGPVNAPAVWGFYSGTDTVVVHLSAVTTTDGRIFRISC